VPELLATPKPSPGVPNGAEAVAGYVAGALGLGGV
jgi:hypothetical protein